MNATCPNCGRQEKEGARYCGQCGVELTSEETPATVVATSAAVGAGTVRAMPTVELPRHVLARDDAEPCPNCGHPEPADSRFCSECGATIAKPSAMGADARPSAGPPAPWPLAGRVDPSATVIDRFQVPVGPPLSAAPRAAEIGRKRLPLFVGAIVTVLFAGGTAGALFATGVIGKSSEQTLSNSTFLQQVDQEVLASVVRADNGAQTSINALTSSSGRSTLFSSGVGVESASEHALTALSSIGPISRSELSDETAIRSFLEANRTYGLAIENFARGSAFADLSSAAASTAGAVREASSALPSGTELPTESTFRLQLPSTQPSPKPSSSGVDAQYVNQINGMLERSHRTLLRVEAFTSRVVSRSLSGQQAINDAEGFVSDRQSALEAVQALAPPAGFAQAQALLESALQTSIADDQALVQWAAARANGSNAQVELNRVNQIGLNANALKRRFLASYRAAVKAATGHAAMVPDSF